MKKVMFTACLMILIHLGCIQTKANPNDIVFLEPNSSGTVGQYEKLELGIVISSDIKSSIDLFFASSTSDYLTGNGSGYNTAYINPYDPDQISVEATFHYIDNPNIPDQVIYGFYYRKFGYSKTPIISDATSYNATWIEQSVPYNWRIRFAPKYTGNWNVKLIIKKSGTVVYNESTGKNFLCTTSSNPGFLIVGNSKRYLRFQNGQPFYPIGLNIAWPNPDKPSPFDGNNQTFYPIENVEHKDFIRKLGQTGGNYCRIMNAPWSYTIETTLLGNYDNKQPIMWEFDDLVNIAKSNNIYIQLSMDMFEYFLKSSSYPGYKYTWDYNVYKSNNLNGGAGISGVNTPSDFLTNVNAINQYKKRIRYIISRWGYSTNIASFEIFNEAMFFYITYNTSGSIISDWHHNISNYIKNTIKHTDHLISTSTSGYNWAVDNDKLIDFNTCHSYNNFKRNGNMHTAADVLFVLNYTSKPCLLGEIGGGGQGCMDRNDIFYHNILWGSAFTGSLGAGLDWWWWKDVNSTAFVKDISNLKTFINNVDFDNEAYYPQINYNSSFNYSTYRNNFIEAITLTNNRGTNSSKAIGWVHNRSHYFYNLINSSGCKYYDSNLKSEFDICNYGTPPDDDIINCPVDVLNEPVTIKNMNSNTSYEVVWYNTNSLQKVKTEVVQSNSLGEVVITPPKLDENNFDFAYTISCSSRSGWSEKKTCPGQWNLVISNSELETDGTGIYYINFSNQICALYKNGSTWGDAILILNAPVASQNSGILFNSTDNCIYYIGTNGKIYKFSYTNGIWANSQVCSGQWNSTKLNSDLVTDGTSIYYINTNNQVCALYKSGTSWGDAILNSSSPNSISSGRGLLFNSADASIYYIGTNGKIYKFSYTNGIWVNSQVCSGQWNIAISGSELKVDVSGSTIYYINSNKYVCALYKNGTTWGDAVLSNIQVKNSSHFTSKNGLTYFIGIDNNIYKLYYTSSGWKSEPILQSGSCQQFANSGIIATSSNIYYTGSDNYIHDLSYQ